MGEEVLGDSKDGRPKSSGCPSQLRLLTLPSATLKALWREALEGQLAAKIEGMQMAAIRPTARSAWQHGDATAAMVGDGL